MNRKDKLSNLIPLKIKLEAHRRMAIADGDEYDILYYTQLCEICDIYKQLYIDAVDKESIIHFQSMNEGCFPLDLPCLFAIKAKHNITKLETKIFVTGHFYICPGKGVKVFYDSPEIENNDLFSDVRILGYLNLAHNLKFIYPI